MSLRPWRLLCCTVFLVFLVLCLASSPVQAASRVASADSISVSSRTARIAFPKSIDFQITANDSTGLITKATIYIQSGPFDQSDSHMVSIASPGHSITAKWSDDTNGNDYLPPGTQISYYWIITDNVGLTHTDQTQHLAVTDNRFAWQQSTRGMIQIHWYSQPTSFGQGVLTQANNALTRISNNLGGGLTKPINLWIYQSETDFHNALPQDVHEWVGGIAFPGYDVALFVIKTMNDDTLVRDMPHEMTHLTFHQLTDQGILAPTWLDEGLAVYNQSFHEPEMERAFKQAMGKNALIPLDTLSRDFPADADKAYLAYAQSWQLVDYMYKTFGQPKIVALIKDMNKSNTNINEDMQKDLGVDVRHLENQWHVSLRLPPTLSPAELTPTPIPAPTPVPPPVATTDSSGTLLVLGGLLLFVVPLLGLGGLIIFVRRSRARARVGQLAEQIIQESLRQQPQQFPPYGQQAPYRYANPARYMPPTAPPQTPPAYNWPGPAQQNNSAPARPDPNLTEQNPYADPSRHTYQEYARYDNKNISQE